MPNVRASKLSRCCRNQLMSPTIRSLLSRSVAFERYLVTIRTVSKVFPEQLISSIIHFPSRACPPAPIMTIRHLDISLLPHELGHRSMPATADAVAGDHLPDGTGKDS